MQGRVIDGPGRRRDLLQRVPLLRRTLVLSLDAPLLTLLIDPSDYREETHELIDIAHRIIRELRHVAPGGFLLRLPEGRDGLLQKLVVVALQKPDPIVGFRRGFGLLVRHRYALVRGDRVIHRARGLKRTPHKKEDAVQLVAVAGPSLEVSEDLQGLLEVPAHEVDFREPHPRLERQASAPPLTRHAGVLLGRGIEIADVLVVLGAQKEYLRAAIAPGKALQSLLVRFGRLGILLPGVPRPPDENQSVVGKRVRRRRLRQPLQIGLGRDGVAALEQHGGKHVLGFRQEFAVGMKRQELGQTPLGALVPSLIVVGGAQQEKRIVRPARVGVKLEHATALLDHALEELPLRGSSRCARRTGLAQKLRLTRGGLCVVERVVVHTSREETQSSDQQDDSETSLPHRSDISFRHHRAKHDLSPGRVSVSQDGSTAWISTSSAPSFSVMQTATVSLSDVGTFLPT